MVKPSPPEQTIQLELDILRKVNFDLRLSDLVFPEDERPLKLQMSKGNYAEAVLVNDKEDIIRIKFNPSHLTFNKEKEYTDIMMIETAKSQWSYEIVFNQVKKVKKPQNH